MFLQKINTIPRLGVVGLMTIYWLSKFYSKERRILFRMDETLHHVDVPHPIHFLTHPNCLLFFICVCMYVCVCVCVYVSVFPGVRNHTIHIHKYLCTDTQCMWRVGGYDGLRLYLPWFHPITQGQSPAPPSFLQHTLSLIPYIYI